LFPTPQLTPQRPPYFARFIEKGTFLERQGASASLIFQVIFNQHFLHTDSHLRHAPEKFYPKL
jgi:hypothetical protein